MYAGMDPYNFYIDRNSADNVLPVRWTCLTMKTGPDDRGDSREAVALQTPLSGASTSVLLPTRRQSRGRP